MMKLADYLMQQPGYGYGANLMQQGTQTTPTRTWVEALARGLQGVTGAYTVRSALDEAKGQQAGDQQALAGAMEAYGKGDSAGARQLLASHPNLADTSSALMMQDVALQKQKDLLTYQQQLQRQNQQADYERFLGGSGNSGASGGGDYASAISGIESGGNYNAIGPQTPQGRALGKYQVMPSNVGPWTKEVLGHEMTPEQFLANPQAQDAVFKGKFGQYVQKYGPQGAARAWFAGEGGMNNPNATDVNGTTVAGYGQKFTAGLGPQQQSAGTVNFQGIQLPRAELAAALGITDQKARQQAIADVVKRSIDFQRNGPNLERVRDEQGNETLVPRGQAAGLVSHQNVSPAGTTEGDVQVLQVGDPSSPEYAQAYNRLSQPKQAQNGQLLYPNMSAYRPPTGQPQGQPGVRIQDTPMSQFQMSGKLADDFNALQPVKDYRSVVPIYESMKDAATRNNKAADLNLVYGFAKVMDPGSVVREGEIGMARGVQSLPDWVKSQVNSMLTGNSALSPQARQYLLSEAESRAGALKNQYDSIAQQFSDRAQRYGLNPQDVLTAPSTQVATPTGQSAVPVYDISGKRIK